MSSLKSDKCKRFHDWNIGAGISNNNQEIGIFLCCKNCNKIVEAYYKEPKLRVKNKI